ncbi:alpha/beta hydrolase [Neorhizobium galegae]|uniref:alpha/beta hydrolase n=1 Tax=Neorhizobium galegae TaxID=399 RepID=UPI00062213D7|nr:alpha/beta hydrolase [Neorhizobium galegae]MCQ1768307.1 alpha/beta hydrolase [Neorhizobium galegae]MCQ1847279.1 alpha/beta hydrolase [Neorhizobium galegae]CDZ26700.1 Hydrolase, alpha/beta domain protein [Neorhizobium galegae bv. officinalis]CDZ34509.1 Hydrolase, alpha/beta domain protein [Neorhizobium galegae bv. officinalis]
MTTKADWQRTPLIVSFPETAKYTETYGFAGNSGRVNLEGQLLRGTDAPSKTVYVFMHPTSTLQLLPMPTALADAGLHVLCAASRYPKNDTALIMEKVAIDLGKWLDFARSELGYEKVVLVGWSGGGSLSLFYQAQAENPTITHTPAGDEVNLVEAGLKPADGVIFIAAHLSRAETLTEWLDPSVLDELDPDLRDPEFDIYSPDCPHQPPYSAEFIQRFRAAQVARNRKITHWVLDMLAELKRRGSFEQERAFIVHRTMCDVRWFDGTIDPNDRPIGRSYMGDPRTVNVGPVGLARFTTLRSWLSQWSYDLSNAKGPMNAALIKRSPVLQIENNADEAVPATHNPAIRAALATQNKEYMTIPHATHYYLGQPELLKACIDRVIDWSKRQGLLS